MRTMSGQRYVVVGGGIVGAAVARRLLQIRPAVSVTVLEKEDRLAAQQTGRNSGVVHAGSYHVPGSLKATLCRRGVGLLNPAATSSLAIAEHIVDLLLDHHPGSA